MLSGYHLRFHCPGTGDKEIGRVGLHHVLENVKKYVRAGAEKIKFCDFMAGVNCTGKLESLIDLLRR